MKIYEVVVGMWGADSPRKFYFKSREKAMACYKAHEHADAPEEFESDDFPSDMLSDASF